MQGVQKRWGEDSRPIVLALSNPSEVAECTAQQAYDWSDGRAVYASGTAFDPFDTKEGLKVPAQANNSLIFPGLPACLPSGMRCLPLQSIVDDLTIALYSVEKLPTSKLRQNLYIHMLIVVRCARLTTPGRHASYQHSGRPHVRFDSCA